MSDDHGHTAGGAAGSRGFRSRLLGNAVGGVATIGHATQVETPDIRQRDAWSCPICLQYLRLCVWCKLFCSTHRSHLGGGRCPRSGTRRRVWRISQAVEGPFYVSVGLTVITLQKLQVRATSCASSSPSGRDAKTQFRPSPGAFDDRVKVVEERLEGVEARSTQCSTSSRDRLPEQARESRSRPARRPGSPHPVRGIVGRGAC